MPRKLQTANKEKVENFKQWLSAMGLEERPQTNEWEVFRFNSSRGLMVLYCNKQKLYTPNSNLLNEAWECFLKAEPLPWRGKARKRVGGSKRRQKEALIARDGQHCFYCGEFLHSREITLEHLLSLVHGGSYRLENLVLACPDCNTEAGHKPIIEKVKIRERKQRRGQHGESDNNTY